MDLLEANLERVQTLLVKKHYAFSVTYKGRRGTTRAIGEGSPKKEKIQSNSDIHDFKGTLKKFVI